MNSTMASASSALYDQLYSNVDFDALNSFERLWVQWYVMIGNPILATGLMSFLLHEVRDAFYTVRFVILTSSPGRVLRTVSSMDRCRCDALFPSMEAATQQGSITGRAVGMHQTSSVVALHH